MLSWFTAVAIYVDAEDLSDENQIKYYGPVRCYNELFRAVGDAFLAPEDSGTSEAPLMLLEVGVLIWREEPLFETDDWPPPEKT